MVNIIQQPEINSVSSAYLPIVIACKTNYEVCYCDVFIEGKKEKTLSKSVKDTGGNFVFDIKDVLQELLSFSLPDIGYSDVLEQDQHIKIVYAELSPASISEDGKIQIQNEKVKSNEFYVANVILQHEEGTSVLDRLSLYKTGKWDNRTYHLTKRPIQNTMCRDDNSFFPILTDKTPQNLCIVAKTIYGGKIILCKDLKAQCPDITLEIEDNVLSGASIQTIIFKVIGDTSLYQSINFSYKKEGFIRNEKINIENNRVKLTVAFGKYDIAYTITGNCIGKINKSISGVCSENIPLEIRWEDGSLSGSGDKQYTKAISNVKDPVGYSVWAIQNGSDIELLTSFEGFDTSQTLPLKNGKNTIWLTANYESKSVSSNEITYIRTETGGGGNDTNVITTTTLQYLNGGKIGSKVKQWQSPNPEDNNSYCHELNFDDFENAKIYRIKQSSKYKVKLDYTLAVNSGGSPTSNVPYNVYMSINGEDIPRLVDRIPSSDALLTLTSAGSFTGNIEKDLKEGDVISFFYYFRLNGLIHDITAKLTIDIKE